MDQTTLTGLLRGIPAKSRRRAAKSGIVYLLPDDYAAELYRFQHGRCDITGLRFSMQQFPQAFVQYPFAPSLDRKDSHGGYTVDNVRLVFVCVNFGVGQWGQEVYLHCARAAVEHDRVVVGLKPEPVLPDHSDIAGATLNLERPTQPQAVAVSEWDARLRDRVDAAEVIAKTLVGDGLLRQRRHIASLKRNLALGQEGLSRAAYMAAKTRAARKSGGR